MWALTNGGAAILEVFRSPRSFNRLVPNPEYGKEVPELAQDATPEQAADHLLLELRAENEPEHLTLQESPDVFTKWTEAQRRAIGILPIEQDPRPDEDAVSVTGSTLTVDGDVVRESWTTAEPDAVTVASRKGQIVREKVALIKSNLLSRLEAGFDFRGKKVQLNDDARANITAVAAIAKFALLNLGTFPGVEWTCADDSKLPLDAQGMSDLADEAFLTYQEWRDEAKAKRDELVAMVADEAMTVADVRAFQV